MIFETEAAAIKWAKKCLKKDTPEITVIKFDYPMPSGEKYGFKVRLLGVAPKNHWHYRTRGMETVE